MDKINKYMWTFAMVFVVIILIIYIRNVYLPGIIIGSVLFIGLIIILIPQIHKVLTHHLTCEFLGGNLKGERNEDEKSSRLFNLF